MLRRSGQDDFIRQLLQAMNAIALIDPVTEWKPVLQAAKQKKMVAVAVQLSPVPHHMTKFIPSEQLLQEAGVDHILNLQDRDCYHCVHALQLLERTENLRIQGIIPLAETAVDFVDNIAAMLGLTHHNPLHLVTSRRDKGFMKDTVLRSGIRVASYARIRDPCEIFRFMDDAMLNWPVVIKTPQGFSTTNVFICEDEQEGKQALDTIIDSIGPEGQRASHALIEEFVEGTEFAVNFMAFQGKLTVTDVWKYTKTKKAQYCQAEICDPNDNTLHHVLEYSTRIARAVGIDYGAGHVEVKASRDYDGTYVDPCMIEVGARLSGGRKASMTHVASKGIWNPFLALVDVHCGIEPEFPLSFTPQLFALHLFLPIERAGYIKDINLNETILITLNSSVMLVKQGEYVEETTDITTCAGFLWFVGNRKDVEEDVKRALSSFKITLIGKHD